MKKIIINILIIAILIPTFLGAFQPKVAEASCIPALLPTAVGGSNFKISDCINDVATTVMLPLVGKFLQVSGFLFGLSVKANLYIGDLVDNPSGNGSTVIGEVWKNIRDISSIFFIGMLLYASFSMILGVGGANVNQVIVSMVLAGLLMNFSLFGTRLVIDASNTAALVFYNAITPSGGQGQPRFGQNGITTGGGSAIDNIGNYALSADAFIDDGGISNNIMAALQLQTLFAQSSSKQNPAKWILQSITIMVGGSIMMIVAGLAFLAGAIMFIYRLVTLILLMAFSPLPVIAIILPQTSKYAKEWSSTLISQCLFAPIYLFLMYVALKIATDGRLTALFGSKGKAGLVDVFTGAYVGPLLQYTIVIMLMYYALVAAKSYGGNGADLGMKWMKGFQSWGQGVVGRNTIGRASRGLGTAYDKVMSSERIQTLASLANKTGIDRTIRTTLKSGEDSKFGSKLNLAGEEKEVKERNKALKGIRETANRGGKIATALKILKDGGTPEQIGQAHTNLKDSIKMMSSAEIKEMDKDTLKNEDFVARLSASQFEALMKNDDISEADKNTMKKARTDGISKLINTRGKIKEKDADGNETEKDFEGVNEIMSGSINDLVKLGDDNLAKIAPYLSRDRYKKILENRDLKASAKDKMEASRKTALNDTFATPPAVGSKEEERLGKLVKSMTSDELFAAVENDVGKLKKLALHLETDHLSNIETEFDKRTQEDIARDIVALANNNGKPPAIGLARKLTGNRNQTSTPPTVTPGSGPNPLTLTPRP